MTEITKDKLISNLNELKRIIEDPEYYIYEYFFELRNKVDLEIETKQFELQNFQYNLEILDKLKEEWLTTIESFERFSKRKSFDFSDEKKRINTLENMLETIDPNLANEIIDAEEINILQNLFKKKSILFTKKWDPDGELIYLQDEFISPKYFEKW
jgi:hypothetical protein